MKTFRKKAIIKAVIILIVVVIIGIFININRSNAKEKTKIETASLDEIESFSANNNQKNESAKKIIEEVINRTENNNNVSEEKLDQVINELTEEITVILEQKYNKIIENAAKTGELNKIIEDYSKKIISNEEIQEMIDVKVNDAINALGNGKDGKNGDKGEKGEDGKDGRTPVKGLDYYTENDIEEMAELTAQKVSQDYMARIVEGVTLNLMRDGNITLSTYEKDIIETIVTRLMEENTSQIYIKEQVIDTVQNMISSSLADNYDKESMYDKGSVVTYEGNLYISNNDNNNDIPGTSNSWSLTTLTRLLSSFNRDVTSQLEKVDYNYYPDDKGSGKVVITLHKGGRK